MRLQTYLTEIKGDIKPTNEMVSFFKERTKTHIKYVYENCRLLAARYPELIYRGKLHDISKYGEYEYIPYIWMTWKYKMKNDGKVFEYPSNTLETSVEMAVDHHYKSNRHHPEFHENSNDMTEIDIAEMVCDWYAMSMEFGDDVKKWANKSIKRYRFNDDNAKLIYQFIEDLVQ